MFIVMDDDGQATQGETVEEAFEEYKELFDESVVPEKLNFYEAKKIKVQRKVTFHIEPETPVVKKTVAKK